MRLDGCGIHEVEATAGRTVGHPWTTRHGTRSQPQKSGRPWLRDELARENIVGTPDMKKVANEKINTGQEARDFAAGMRVHTLEATKGQTYAQMPRFLDKNGNPTADEKAAAVDPKSGEPVSNPARNIWVTETALTNALNTSYFAENVANFAIVMGLALLLAGIGFLVLTLRLPWRRQKEQEAASKVAGGQPALAH